MGKGIITEKFQFIGDSNVNKVKVIEDGKTKGIYSQTEIITLLAQSKEYVHGGIKLKTKDNSPKQGYIIYYKGTEEEPKQFIRITFDKANLEKGDINALAIDNICKYSVKVTSNRIKAGILASVATVGIAAGFVGALVWADKKEQDIETKKNEEYQKYMQEERMKNTDNTEWLNRVDDVLEIDEAQLRRGL